MRRCGTHQAEHLPGPRDRQPVQLEGVGRVAVGGAPGGGGGGGGGDGDGGDGGSHVALLLQVGREVDDGDSLEGAFLHADTTADAERLGDGGDPGGVGRLL